MRWSLFSWLPTFNNSKLLDCFKDILFSKTIEHCTLNLKLLKVEPFRPFCLLLFPQSERKIYNLVCLSFEETREDKNQISRTTEYAYIQTKENLKAFEAAAVQQLFVA